MNTPLSYKKIVVYLTSLTVLIILCLYGILRWTDLDLIYRKENFSIPLSGTKNSGTPTPLLLTSDTIAKNVILFNIAGMGVNQIQATRYRFYGKEGRLNLERMPVTGLINNTPAGDPLVSGPHAAVAALSKGKKALRGRLSSEKEQMSLMHAFKYSGMSTGLITNSYITGASTAAFGSSVEKRSMQVEVAKQMVDCKFNFMLGGGNAFYKSGFGLNGERTGIEYAKSQGYTIVKDKGQFFANNDSLILALFDGMYSNRYNREVAFDPKNPTIMQSTNKAINLLSRSDKGFFLLVDDEGTDYGGYSNRGLYLTDHLKLMDDAIGLALKFAEQDKQTLVLVLTEAESGGLVIVGGGKNTKTVELQWASNKHTGQLVPIFAFGPGCLKFTRIIENTEIPRKLARLKNIDF